MKLLLAPDKFKGTFTAHEVCRGLKAAFLARQPTWEVTTCPLADGGDGTLAALQATGAFLGILETQDAHGHAVQSPIARWQHSGRHHLVVESAACVGLTPIPIADRKPLQSSSYGLGRLLRSALQAANPHASVTRAIVALGGTATVDGGLGFLQALGAEFKTPLGVLDPPGDALSLETILEADLSGAGQSLAGVSLVAWCDVLSPLLGPRGAARLYGPQKGVKPDEVGRLESGLGSFARVLEKVAGVPLRDMPGSGAAGGLGLALASLGAPLEPGFTKVAQAVDLEKQIRDCDAVITGEGRLDNSTREGKVPWGVLQTAARYRKPCFLVTGSAEFSDPSWNGLVTLTGTPGDPHPPLDWEGAAERLIDLMGRSIRTTQG